MLHDMGVRVSVEHCDCDGVRRARCEGCCEGQPEHHHRHGG